MRFAPASLCSSSLALGPAAASARAWQGVDPGVSTQARGGRALRRAHHAREARRADRPRLPRRRRRPEGTRQAQFHVDAARASSRRSRSSSPRQLDAESIEGTYGKPPQRTFVEDTFQKVWLYPAAGRDRLLRQGRQRRGAHLRAGAKAAPDGARPRRRPRARRPAPPAERASSRARRRPHRRDRHREEHLRRRCSARAASPVVDADALARAVVEPGHPGARRDCPRLRPGGARAGRHPRPQARGGARLRGPGGAPAARGHHPPGRPPGDGGGDARGSRRRGHALVFYDTPLLYEVGLDAALDAVVVVWAPAALQRARLRRARRALRRRRRTRGSPRSSRSTRRRPAPTSSSRTRAPRPTSPPRPTGSSPTSAGAAGGGFPTHPPVRY